MPTRKKPAAGGLSLDSIAAAINTAVDQLGEQAEAKPTRAARKPKTAATVLTLYGRVGPGRQLVSQELKVREYKIGSVAPYEDRERTVVIEIIKHGGRKGYQLRVPDNDIDYATITAGDEVVYDSRSDTDPPGALSPDSPGQTDRVREIVARNNAKPAEAEQTAIVPGGHNDPDSFKFELLDDALRREARAVAHSMVRFKELIVEAKADRIHEKLGFKSWTVYIADVIGKEMKSLPVDDRRQIVALLAGEGMSNRAIAEAVGVNEITVRRDRDEVRHDVAPADATEVSHDDSPADQSAAKLTPVTGRDGKTYPPRPAGPVKKARKLTPDLAVLTSQLTKVMAELDDLPASHPMSKADEIAERRRQRRTQQG